MAPNAVQNFSNAYDLTNELLFVCISPGYQLISSIRFVSLLFPHNVYTGKVQEIVNHFEAKFAQPNILRIRKIWRPHRAAVRKIYSTIQSDVYRIGWLEILIIRHRLPGKSPEDHVLQRWVQKPGCATSPWYIYFRQLQHSDWWPGQINKCRLFHVYTDFIAKHKTICAAGDDNGKHTPEPQENGITTAAYGLSVRFNNREYTKNWFFARTSSRHGTVKLNDCVLWFCRLSCQLNKPKTVWELGRHAQDP